jgi:hypothetical protein
VKKGTKKRVSYLYRTATTAYPCYLPILGEFSRSWSYKTYPAQKYNLSAIVQNNYPILTLLSFPFLNYICYSNKVSKKSNYYIMEQNVNVWKANLTNGLILALVGIVYSLVMYFLDLTLNKVQGYVFIVVLLVILYFLLKSYRDNYRHGLITYGESVGAGVIISLYYVLVMAVFTYILYTVIDPGLITKQLAQAEDGMRAKGNLTEAQIDAGMKFTEKIMKPGMMVIISIFFGMIWATIVSLIVSIFIKKEGNPLIDTPTN